MQLSPETQHIVEQAEQEDAGAPGAKRWRGRRRRRGGRGDAAPAEAIAESTAPAATPATYIEEVSEAEHEVAPQIQAAGERPARAPRTESAPAPFVLPGESLTKYGGKPAESATKPTAETPARPASSFKPATLVDAAIEWDGSGLLPGESLSKHRNRPAEPVIVQNVEETSESASEDAVEPIAAITEVELVSKWTKASGLHDEQVSEDFVEEELVEEDLIDAAPEAHEADASASHNVDSQPPTGFRLFGFGNKKKEEEAAKSAQKPAAKSATSNYAPGSGLLEEEVIEEEEFDAPRHHHRAKGGDHDSDEFEEETLPKHLRTGDLGEMLQEAHLDHRIQLNFDEKSEDEDEEAGGEGQPAAGGQGQQKRERSGRGRRGARPGAVAPASGVANKGRGMSRRTAQTSDLPIISDLLKPGQEILVQIAKEPIAKKGARITSHIALPGRFLVFMPTVTHIGVSRKIASDEERQRLKRILVHERGEAAGGFIVRTAAEGASEEELRADLRFLLNLWNEIKQRSDDSKSPALIYHDLSLIERILRDQVSTNFSNIWVDSEANYERIVRFLNRFSPSLVRRVKLYTKELPLFEHFGIQDEISKALRSKVWLKSGGSIVINQTEALVAIDINTGKYVGKSARLEDTIVKTNLDAVPEIVRQIRLRDLGGIIVIDFIDMDDRKNRYKVMAALEEALKSDRAPTKVLQFNDFGLVAITRKRVKQSLERTLSVPCPTCQATGMVKSPTTVCNEIYTELRKMKKHFEGADIMLRVNPETVKVLKSNNASWLTEFEELIGKNILVKSDAALHPEQFDIQG
jgi:ribonuclease G